MVVSSRLNQLPIVLFVNLIPVSLPLTCLFLLLPHLLTLSTHSSPTTTPFLFPSRFKCQNLPLSQIFRTIDSLPASGLTPRTLWQDRFWASRFLFFFSLLLCFLVPCGRSWLFVNFWMHVNIAHHVRIVSFIWSSLQWKGSTALRLNRKTRPRTMEWPRKRPVRWTTLRHSIGPYLMTGQREGLVLTPVSYFLINITESHMSWVSYRSDIQRATCAFCNLLWATWVRTHHRYRLSRPCGLGRVVMIYLVVLVACCLVNPLIIV